MTNGGYELPHASTVMQLVAGKFVAQGLAVVAELRVADALAAGPRTPAEIAADVGAHPGALGRVMRALASAGVFKEVEGERFELTPVGECLRSDVPASLAALAAFMGAPWHNELWSSLRDCVRTGEPATKRVFGESGFAWMAKHPKEAKLFNDAMTSVSRGTAAALVSAYDFSDVESVCDVGGGHGLTLATILRAAPWARGAVFDLPHAAAGAHAMLREHGVEARAEVLTGDFFEGVPPGYEVYVLKSVLHDWGDEACETILHHCREGLEPGGRVLVVEQLLQPHGAPSPATLLDLEMLVMTEGGRERTEAELRALLARAGLSLARVIPTRGPASVLEAVPS